MWSCCVEFFTGSMLQYHHWHAVYRARGWHGRMGFKRGVIWLATMAVYGCARSVALCDDGAAGRSSQAALWSAPAAETS